MAGDDCDWISDLPVDIKISILSRLDVKSAIRASALARSWCHLWTLLPSLRLGEFLDNIDGANGVTYDWLERVYHLLSSLRGPLLKFYLFHDFTDDQSVLLQRILDLLLHKGGVENLLFYNYKHRLVLRLPSFHSLKELCLNRCHIALPTGFRGFKLLATIFLIEVEISNNDLHSLIHKSNSLTDFSGFQFSVVSGNPLTLNFSCPLLRHLEFEINNSIEEVSGFSAASLERASISVRMSTGSKPENVARLTLELLSRVATVSVLELNYRVLSVSFI
jgi:hypothetical protein